MHLLSLSHQYVPSSHNFIYKDGCIWFKMPSLKLMGYLYSKFTRYCCSGGGNSSKNQNQAIKNTEGHGLKRFATGMRSEKLVWPSTLLIRFRRLYFVAENVKINLFWQDKREDEEQLCSIAILWTFWGNVLQIQFAFWSPRPLQEKSPAMEAHSTAFQENQRCHQSQK